jgi:pyruvate dehydrogenase E2 component (dihydrolipoamide acetyltransferase)
MAEVITMPKLSDTMTEGVVASWLVKVGDKVKSGDILAEIESDKATMEFESYYTGTVLYLGVKEKEALPINAVLAIVGDAGEDFSHLIGGAQASAPVAPSAPAPVAPVAAAPAVAPAPVAAGPISVSGASVVTMPKMSDTMKEGVISKWLVKVGDKVKSGDIIAEVETDKATMEMECYEDGTVLYLAVDNGGSVEIDAVVAIVGVPGTDYTPLLKGPSSAPAAPAAPAVQAASPVAAPVSAPAPVVATAAAHNTDGRVKASPLAKKLAAEKGINIAQVSGSGEHGRIVKKDIETFVPAAPVATPAAKPAAVANYGGLQESFTEETVSQMRKTIARRLSESLYTSPHFYLTMEINMDKAIEARKSINETAEVKVSFNDMVIKAVALALRKHPKVNSSWLGDKIRFNQHVHIGVAVAVEEGLLVPVVRFADTKSLSRISEEVKELGGKAKNKKLQPSDWEGNTFTISNLGMFGIEEFTAIINPPDACILAVGAIKQTPVVKDGQIKVGNVMKVTLSCDHRAVDGAVGSAFLQTFKTLLEDPIRMLA